MEGEKDQIEREIEGILTENEGDFVHIDMRADQFWNIKRNWLPIGLSGNGPMFPVENSIDKIYGRYTVGVTGQGTKTEDYVVIDERNNKFSATLAEFLDLHSERKLPVEKPLFIQVVKRFIFCRRARSNQ